jgi:hypothetical protein
MFLRGDAGHAYESYGVSAWNLKFRIIPNFSAQWSFISWRDHMFLFDAYVAEPREPMARCAGQRTAGARH